MSKIIGGLLLIIGTSIGGGMLALPIANASHGLIPSIFYLILCWAIMLTGALYILEANLNLPIGKDMVSMAAATLGPWGLLVAWVAYLALLYSLLSAYLAGGTEITLSFFKMFQLNIPSFVATLIFTFTFGSTVYKGIRRVDLVNRGLMFAKLAIYFILVLWIAPKSNIANFNEGTYKPYFNDFMVMITAFGFAIIIPNLRVYFNDDTKTLKKIIIWGSLIPLFCYILWDATIMGAIPINGADGLLKLFDNPLPTTSLASLLSSRLNNSLIINLFNSFTSICMLTAFLGVALCLTHFLADGLKLKPSGAESNMLFVITFLPPMLIVLFFPNIYIAALNKAGMFCTILLLILPAMMVLKIRYHKYSGNKIKQIINSINPVIIIILSCILLVL